MPHFWQQQNWEAVLWLGQQEAAAAAVAAAAARRR